MNNFLNSVTFLVVVFAVSQQTAAMQPTAAAECVSGRADRFPCHEVNLLAHMDRATLFGPIEAQAYYLSDLWGWTDPATGKEYALVGRSNGLQFVDVSEPTSPRILGTLPTQNEQTSIWRDVKVYKDFAFVVMDSATDTGMQVFDLTQLRNSTGPDVVFEPTEWYADFDAAHNIVINEESGFAYAVGGSGSEQGCDRGYNIIDIRNPREPTFAGCHSASGYVHDAQCVMYHGPDQDHAGKEICFGFNEDNMTVVDMTDKAAPKVISVSSYPNTGYTHQGWLTSDFRHVIMNDEADEYSFSFDEGPRTLIWDVEDIDDPILHREFHGTEPSVDHNLYVHGNYVYQANYSAGMRILDIADIDDPREVAFFDTDPYATGHSTFGAWSVYPFFESGTLVVSSQDEGLFLLKATGLQAATPTGVAADGTELPTTMQLLPAHPNPFNPATVLTLQLPVSLHVRVAAFDVTGREVRLLHEGVMGPGEHTLRFDAAGLPSGRYAIRANAGSSTTSTRFVTLTQ